MIAYFDTSAFVKLVVAEAGSKEVARIWDAASRVASSILLYPEGRAALARARRDRRLDRAALRLAVEDFEAQWAGVERILVSLPLAERAGTLADEHALRGYDAVHLASAEAVAADDIVFVAADGPLCAAARQLGLAVAPIALG
ncbi:MAG: type II toxin-antitoxin system VapC family toxin [Candidatus Binatia bacterium]